MKVRSLWHGFWSETVKLIIKAIEFSEKKVEDYYRKLSEQVDITFQEAVKEEMRSVINRLENVKSFIKETEHRSKGVNSEYINYIQEQIRSVLEVYTRELDGLIEIMEENKLLLKEKKQIENIIKSEQYANKKCDLYLKYYEGDEKVDENDIEIFVSYSSKDKKLAGKISKILEEEYDLHTFLAHEEIDINQIWRGEILKHLESSKGLLAIVTDNFVTSSWTHQEVGFFLGSNKRIVPLFYTINSTGFLESRQGINMQDLKLEEAIKRAHEFFLK